MQQANVGRRRQLILLPSRPPPPSFVFHDKCSCTNDIEPRREEGGMDPNDSKGRWDPFFRAHARQSGPVASSAYAYFGY